MDALEQQLSFLIEVDKLKSVDRQNMLVDGTRVENTAEHSWHLALYAMTLADHAPKTVDIQRVITMLLIHDIVEIDVGDHPIHLQTDWEKVAQAEQAAARRIFGLLPKTQATYFIDLWTEFEAAETEDAKFAKLLDHIQPIFQTVFNKTAIPDHVEVVRENLTTGRARMLSETFPAAYRKACEGLGWQLKGDVSPDFDQQIAFLLEVDQLKQVYRATTLCDGSRRENSGEHSWHIVMYALVLAGHANRKIDILKVMKMLIIHDLVEIDAGDMPIHGDHDIAVMEAIEQAAADRIFGLLPAAQNADFRAIWEEFEAAESDDAVYAKSVDRVQPVISNLETGGGSWVEYNVSRQQLEDRVGWKVAKGAPALWDALQARIRAWFAANQATDTAEV